jgi:HlyD family secretion protein
MEFDISVDELDIAKIEVGMSANVTLDALTGKNFDGVVSKISGTGTSSNGVTTYPVTVVIKNPSGIKEGMNANAEIKIQHKDNVLTLPINAVQKMGSRYFVFVKNADGTNSSQSTNQWSGKRNNKGTVNDSENQQNGQRQNNSSQNKNSNSRQQNMLKLLGPGVSMKSIQVGINNDNDIEIVSGLNEGDKVEVPVVTTTSTIQQQSGGFPFGGGGNFNGSGNRNYNGGGGNSNSSNNKSSSGNSSSNRNSNQSNSGGGNRD